MHIVPVLKNWKRIPVEIEFGKTLNFNPGLSLDEHKCNTPVLTQFTLNGT